MSDVPYLRPVDDGVEVTVWVVPGARRDEIVGIHGDALKVKVAAPPEGGRANRSVAALLQAATGAGRAEIVAGHTHRRKRVVLHGVDADQARRGLDGR